MYMTWYMFNVTNPDDVTQGAKPNVTLVGPFNYLETRIKHNWSWNGDKTRVQYFYNRTFTRIETPCPPGELYPTILCSLDDSMNVTTGNIAMATVAMLTGPLFNGLYGDFEFTHPKEAAGGLFCWER